MARVRLCNVSCRITRVRPTGRTRGWRLARYLGVRREDESPLGILEAVLPLGTFTNSKTVFEELEDSIDDSRDELLRMGLARAV